MCDVVRTVSFLYGHLFFHLVILHVPKAKEPNACAMLEILLLNSLVIACHI